MLCVAALAAPRVTLPRLLVAMRAVRPRHGGDSAERVGRRVERLGARIPGATGCFPQAIASAVLLRRHGHVPEIVIGVRNRPFGAHAWVEVAGRIVTGADEAGLFREIWRGSP